MLHLWKKDSQKNLTEEIHKIKYKDCNCFLEFERIKDSLIKYKCLSSYKNYSKKINEVIQEHI